MSKVTKACRRANLEVFLFTLFGLFTWFHDTPSPFPLRRPISTLPLPNHVWALRRVGTYCDNSCVHTQSNIWNMSALGMHHHSSAAAYCVCALCMSRRPIKSSSRTPSVIRPRTPASWMSALCVIWYTRGQLGRRVFHVKKVCSFRLQRGIFLKSCVLLLHSCNLLPFFQRFHESLKV